jgi:predicted RNase H-like HicB family nuclease
MKSYVFKAELQLEDDGRWSSWIDALPGCASWGYTEQEALDGLRAAADLYVEDMIDAGEEIPEADVEVIDRAVVSVSR